MPELFCGPTKFSQGGKIEFKRYSNGELAILVLNADDHPEFKATVNIPEAPSAWKRHAVWLKGWSENEGVPEALVAAGIVTLTGETIQAGFAEAEFAWLTDKALKEIDD